MQTQLNTLLETLHETRNMTFYFLNKLSEEQKTAEPEINGIKLNSALWNMAHIAWAEYFLIHQTFGIDEIHVDWFDKVKIGSPKCSVADLPPLSEILETLDRVHQVTQSHLQKMDDAVLDEDNLLNLVLNGKKSKRMMLIHTIRHEGVHSGQIDWLAKLTSTTAQ